MKKVMLSVISIILCFSLIVPLGASSFAGEKQTNDVSVVSVEDYLAQADTSNVKTTFMKILAQAVNVLSDTVINALGKALGLVIPKTSVLNDYASFSLDEYGNFYKGMDTFLDEPAKGAKWSLGYSEASIMPADFGTKAYAMGGYGLMANTTEKFDDLMVRTIVLDDGSGRGKVVFAVLDAIGIANADVRLIRESLADFAKENNIVSINVSATHTHSGIDLEGVWNDTLNNVLSNLLLSPLGLAEVKSGVDRTFLNTIIASTTRTVKEAVAGMEKGTLTFAKKDIAQDYLRDRTAPYTFDGNLYKLTFTPDKKSAKPTIITSFSAHPENSGYEFEVISADFVPNIEKVINKAGYNFIYIQGCIGTITYQRGASDDGLDLNRQEEAVRYGYEIGHIILGMTKTEAECDAMNYELGDMLGVQQYSNSAGYSVWYNNWTPVTETVVEPLLNIAHKQYIIEVSNPLLDIIGKSGITDFFFLYENETGKYYSVTECGYMEIGDTLKVEICPGETYGELLLGGDGIDGFEYNSLRSKYGENLIVFDLMNDAIGYIEPDNEFVMAGMQYSESKDTFDTDSWCLISFGKHTASKVISEFMDLADNVR